MITLTPKAAEKVKELLNDEDGTCLRIFVQGGGCSGFQYGLALAKEPENSDDVSESNGIKIVVDPISIQYLKDAIVDFVENDSGGGFAVKNPNAKSTCGCGQSFGV